MSASFEVSSWIGTDPVTVFDVALDMEVHAGSLAHTREAAVTSHGHSQLQLGDEVTFTALHLGRRWTMTSRVTAYERPHRFVDEQIEGPFKEMTHEHLFAAEGAGTRMVDRVSFRAPFGVVGLAAEMLGLSRYFERVIALRGTHIKVEAERRRRSGRGT